MFGTRGSAPTTMSFLYQRSTNVALNCCQSTRSRRSVCRRSLASSSHTHLRVSSPGSTLHTGCTTSLIHSRRLRKAPSCLELCLLAEGRRLVRMTSCLTFAHARSGDPAQLTPQASHLSVVSRLHDDCQSACFRQAILNLQRALWAERVARLVLSPVSP